MFRTLHGRWFQPWRCFSCYLPARRPAAAAGWRRGGAPRRRAVEGTSPARMGSPQPGRGNDYGNRNFNNNNVYRGNVNVGRTNVYSNRHYVRTTWT